MAEIIELNDEPAEIEIKLNTKKGVQEFVLTELSGPNGVKYNNFATSKTSTEIDSDGDIKFLGMKDAGDMDLILVSLCLYHKDTMTLVDEATVRSFKHQTTEVLAKKAREINGMLKKKKGVDSEAKN